MMRSKLAIGDQNDDGTWTLYWIADDGDLGGELGDVDFVAEPRAPDDHEIWRANVAAKPFANPVKRSRHGFAFKNRQIAVAAKKAADAAIANVPIEEWEARALAAGWKAPKGWKKKQ